MNTFTAWKKSVAALTDEVLLEKTQALACSEREKTAWLVAHLAEVYRRDLALKRGFPSLHKYAREVLRLSDSQAWERVSAACLALQIPETIERIASGELTLDSAGALWKTLREQERTPRQAAPGLQTELIGERPPENARVSSGGALLVSARAPAPLQMTDKRELFGRVLGKSRRESEAALNEWKQERSGVPVQAKPRLTTVSFELTDDELARFTRLRDLLSHRLPSRDPKEALLWMIEQGLEKVDPIWQEARQEARVRKRNQKVAQKESEAHPVTESPAEAAAGPAPTKSRAATAAKTAAPRRAEPAAVRVQKSRVAAKKRSYKRVSMPRFWRITVRAALKRRIWIRDQGRCQFIDPLTGRKCGATAYLDLDHIRPVCEGGENIETNLRLACRAHNRRRYQWTSSRAPRLTPIL